MTRRISVTALLVLLLGSSVSAHVSNTTNTRMTESALVIIEAEAARPKSNPAMHDAYAELSKNNRRFWGKDERYTEFDAKTVLDVERYLFERPQTVVLGSDAEELPYFRIMSHFYNAYSGAGVHPQVRAIAGGDNHDSEVVAHRYFDQAIEVFGYETRDGTFGEPLGGPDSNPGPLDPSNAAPSTEVGLLLLGHALHHVEDMSSIAHAHNDLHLNLGGEWNFNLRDLLGAEEIDAYEAVYIPTLLWDANEPPILLGLNTERLVEKFPGYVSCASPCIRQADPDAPPPIPVTNFTDIWAEADLPGGMQLGPNGELINAAAGLGRSVYNVAVFQGDFDELVYNEQGCGEEELGDDARAQGEIVEMFGTEDVATCVVTYGTEMDTGNYGWGIEEHEILVNGVPTLSPGPGRWHFRRSMDFDWVWGDPRGLIWPEQDWWPVDPIGGPTDQLFGGQLFYFEKLYDGIQNGADFDPTLLVRPARLRQDLFTVYNPQNNNPVVDQPLSTDFFESQPRSLAGLFAERLIPLGIQYAAGYTQFWYDIANTPPYLKKVRVEQNENVRYEAFWTDVPQARQITRINEFHAGDTVTNFNYVKERVLNIQTIGHIDPEQPFTLIVEFNEPVQREEGPQEIKIFLNNQEIQYDNMRATPPFNGEAWFANREFEIDINGLPDPLPEGEVTLMVQAYDRNFHRDAVDQVPEFGTELDQDPSTPARRQRINADEPREEAAFPKADWGQAKWGDYPWHDEDSIDVEFEDMEEGDFAYDRDGQGDATHVLLFDKTPPTAEFTIRTSP